MTPEHKPGTTWRTTCNRGRVTYWPTRLTLGTREEVPDAQPYYVYVDGTACIQRATLAGARDWLHRVKGLRLRTDRPRTTS